MTSTVQLLEITVVEKSPDHVRWDLARALGIEPVPGRELEAAIGARQRSLETRMKKAVGLGHDHAGGAAVRMTIRMTIGQPEELRGRLRLLGHARSIGSYFPQVEEAIWSEFPGPFFTT